MFCSTRKEDHAGCVAMEGKGKSVKTSRNSHQTKLDTGRNEECVMNAAGV